MLCGVAARTRKLRSKKKPSAFFLGEHVTKSRPALNGIAVVYASEIRRIAVFCGNQAFDFAPRLDLRRFYSSSAVGTLEKFSDVMAVTQAHTATARRTS